MKKTQLTISFLLMTMLSSLCVGADSDKIIVTKDDSLVVKDVPTEHFSGKAKVKYFATVQSPSCASLASVSFEKGARTAWHSHPLGQTLIVTEGEGLVQQWGQPAKHIKIGDVVRIPAGQKHWHGAASSSAMTHMAVQEEVNGSSVSWQELVSEEDYLTANGNNKSNKKKINLR